MALSLTTQISLNDTLNAHIPWFSRGSCGILSLKVALQCNKLAITAGCHKLMIKSNSSTEDYMQMLDEHLTMPAGLINTACCIIAITVNCLKQGRKKKKRLSLPPHYQL